MLMHYVVDEVHRVDCNAYVAEFVSNKRYFLCVTSAEYYIYPATVAQVMSNN
jgi:hypothetical protein